MRILLFALLEIVFFPLQLIGSLVYAFRVRFVNMPRGISGTAYEPFMARLLLHCIASRNDAAAGRIAPHLPALSPLVLPCAPPASTAATSSSRRPTSTSSPGWSR